MNKQRIQSEGAAPPIGPYSPAVAMGGLVFLSGQLGVDSQGQLAEGVAAQTELAMQNAQRLLQAAGLDFAQVVKTSIFLADMNDFAQVNEVYAAFFEEGSVYPARETVQVARLPRDARVEISMIAVRQA